MILSAICFAFAANAWGRTVTIDEDVDIARERKPSLEAASLRIHQRPDPSDEAVDVSGSLDDDSAARLQQ